ncbi:uncharacterized protein Dwil_GK19934 [Drosophila willistoni]|uniref:Uncharacterized protein n=2 Tax=Drosophila willistoni TaxID=7260 RepID=B4MSB4_DROWI|nr:uncharacterized protein Dwil_GK19934 [Drosophila willistoni]
MRSPKRSKSFRKSQSPIMPKTGTQVVDASGIKSKKNRGTPVLFLVKDSAKPQQFMEPMRSMRKRSKLQKPQSHSRSRSRSRAGSWSQAEARADYDASDRRTAYDKSYTKAISELSHSRRPAVGGVEFFYNLGQRVAPPKQRTRLPPLQRLAGGGVGGDDHVTDLEVPLTSRLPIIDFISTTEFQSMYAPQAKRAARRFLM